MGEPLVSVIVCVRNGEKYLRDALDSIERQGIADLEVIVIDGDSKDGSMRIARSHSLNPQVVAQEQLGQGAALNDGVGLARGSYLAFLDCDDVWPLGRLATMLAGCEAKPDADFVFGKTVNTDENLNAIQAPLPARLLGAMLIKRTSALTVGEFRNDVVHGAIVDWNSRAGALGLQSYAIDETVLLRRIHGDNLGIRDRPRANVDMFQVLRDHLDRQQH